MSNNVKVLIAEDDLTSRSMLRSVIEKAGYEPVEADAGYQALSILLAPDAPHLVILDWVLPGMNGLEIVKNIRKTKDTEQPYIIMLTSKSSKNDLITALDAGADDYLIKPYDAAVLKARLAVGNRLIALQEEIRSREKLKGVLEMAGAVSHELNQPLQSVMGFSELMLLDLEESNPYFRMLSKIKEGIERIGELTRKIVSITHYETKSYLTNHIVDIDKAAKQEKPTFVLETFTKPTDK